MKTFNEIERKFLLKRFPRLEKINNVYQIEQWYHSDGFRYRYQVDGSTGETTIFKTKKRPFQRVLTKKKKQY
jgi:hypothetical protein